MTNPVRYPETITLTNIRYRDKFFALDSIKICTNANTVSWGNLTCHNICKVTLTGNEKFKHSTHLITNYLYRDRDNALAHHDGKYCAILACHRDSSPTQNRDRNPAGFASNANSLNCRAVMGN